MREASAQRPGQTAPADTGPAPDAGRAPDAGSAPDAGESPSDAGHIGNATVIVLEAGDPTDMSPLPHGEA